MPKVDLGLLQDGLESAERKRSLANTNTQKAQAAYERAVDREQAWDKAVELWKQQIRTATFTLTRKV